MSKPKKLTPRQQRFVAEYLVDLNATQAAIRAGYSAKTAHAAGPRLLGNVGVAEAIQRGRQKTASKLEVTRERIVQELARIAFADVRNLFVWDEDRACYVPSKELTEDQAAAISEIQAETIRTYVDDEPQDRIKLKIKTYDKQGALELLAKHLGMLIDKHEVTGRDGGPIEVADITDAELVDRARQQASRVALLAVNGNGHRNGNGNGNGKH